MKIIFVCRGNVGRSQMAAGLFQKMAGAGFEVSSAGTMAAQAQTLAEFTPAADNVIACMKEEGIDVSQRVPLQLTPEMVAAADRVIFIADDNDPVPDYLQSNDKVTRWTTLDPKGTDLEFHRQVRGEIKQKVEGLVREILCQYMQIDNNLPVYLLGVCEGFNEVESSRLDSSSGTKFVITSQNLFGLTNTYVTWFLPLMGKGVNYVFVIDRQYILDQKSADGKYNIPISIEDGIGELIGSINFSFQVPAEQAGLKLGSRYELRSVSIQESVLWNPGAYNCFTECGSQKRYIGSFVIGFQPALPLTPERIQAISSDPLAIKKVMIEIGCKKCGDKLRTHVGLEKFDFPGSIWYEDLPPTYQCKCGTERDLKYIKQGFHGVLGYRESRMDVECERMYTHTKLESVIREFRKLINTSDVGEELVQKFIEQNPIILAKFGAKLLACKAPITSRFKTDFAILNHQDELLLVEIERPSMKLFNKDGGQNSGLTHAFDQVSNWLAEDRRDRLGLIDDVAIPGLTIDRVTRVHGVLIAGRRSEEDHAYLQKLLARQDISFYTFDDLLSYLVQVVNGVKEV
jgi:arsenate-mycothiol transferase